MSELPVPILVISACTREKVLRGEPILGVAEIRELLSGGERLDDLRTVPAGQLYVGLQHRLAARSVERLRLALGESDVQFRVLSAGFGLVEEDSPLSAYDVTFNLMAARERRDWADFLDIPNSVRHAVSNARITFVLLTGHYLRALGPPLDVPYGKRVVFFAPRSDHRLLGSDRVTCVPAGMEQARAFGSSTAWLKHQMFDLLADAVIADPQRVLPGVLYDDSPMTIATAIAAAHIGRVGIRTSSGSV